MQGKFPQQNLSQVIGREATRAFEHQIPRQWNSIPSGSNDFGWDFLITIPSTPGQVGDDFFVQVKGSEEVHYLDTSPELSQQLRVETVEWLLSKPMPSMLIVCDVAQSEQSIYWVWISDAVEALTPQNSSWRKQESITLRVPLANRLGPETYERIEEDVKHWHQKQRISQMMLKLLKPEDLSSIPLNPGGAEEYVRQQFVPLFQQAGLMALVETESGPQVETFTSEDRERFKRLQEASVLLRSFRDAEARQILDTEAPHIDTAASSIQAMYFNSRGVLTLREGKEPDAIEMFRQATKLRPSEIKYQVNLLAVEHRQSLKLSCSGTALPSEWDERLNDALSHDPDFILAIQLRTARIAEMENLQAAEAYLRGTSLWERDTVQALATLAELYKEAGQLSRASNF
jgi:hypothetical protein